MVLLVDVLVENTMVQTSVEPVVPSVLKNEENGQVHGDLPPRRERHLERNTDLLAHRVEKPDGESLHHEMGNQDRLKALPLLLVTRNLGLLDLVLVEVWDPVDDGPWQTTAKVHDLMHQEEKKTRGEKVIVDPVVIGCPELLDKVQVGNSREVIEGIGERGHVRKPSVVVVNGTVMLVNSENQYTRSTYLTMMVFGVG